jgi:glycine/D-amino acid oxidase-like deaminating enzyme
MVGWGEQAIGEGLTRTWTGVMGYTIDRLPLIGPVPGRPGLFLSAGYNVSPASCPIERTG